MNRFRRRRAGPEVSGDPVEALLRKEFSRQIAAQRDKVPSAEFIHMVAACNAPAQPRFVPAIWAGWSDAVVLGTITTLVASWWDDITTGLKTLLLLESAGVPWTADMALAGVLLAFTLCWTRTMSHSP